MPLAIAALVLAALWRILTVRIPALGNFSPVMALAFCAGAYTRRGWLWLAPFAALILSDLYIDRYYAEAYRYQWDLSGAVVRMLCFAAAVGLGAAVSKRRNWVSLLGGTLASTLLFYFATNTGSWLSDAGYAHNAAGWWQAMTVGHPQFPPTLFFLRNSLASDLAFAGCFSLAVEYALRRRGEPSLLGLKQVRS